MFRDYAAFASGAPREFPHPLQRTFSSTEAALSQELARPHVTSQLWCPQCFLPPRRRLASTTPTPWRCISSTPATQKLATPPGTVGFLVRRVLPTEVWVRRCLTSRRAPDRWGIMDRLTCERDRKVIEFPQACFRIALEPGFKERKQVFTCQGGDENGVNYPQHSKVLGLAISISGKRFRWTLFCSAKLYHGYSLSFNSQQRNIEWCLQPPKVVVLHENRISKWPMHEKSKRPQTISAKIG